VEVLPRYLHALPAGEDIGLYGDFGMVLEELLDVANVPADPELGVPLYAVVLEELAGERLAPLEAGRVTCRRARCP
jgi:hypothetical protein